MTVRCAGWEEMIFAVVWRGGVSWLWVVALILGGCARASHTPGPSQEGRFRMILSFSNE